MVRSRIFAGRVSHVRFDPVQHTLIYPLYMYAFDLDELNGLDRDVRWFSHNRWNIVSIFDRDYLAGTGTIRSKLMDLLEREGCPAVPDRIELITLARFFGYAFNPVSFYIGYHHDQPVVAAAEVNNTFGERHFYILYPLKHEEQTGGFTASHQKEFHVSPFNNMEGHYEFHFRSWRDRLHITITLIRDGRKILHAALWGDARPLDSRNLFRVLSAFPLTAFKTIPRIHWEALKLYFIKNLPLFKKPPPVSPRTIGKKSPGPVSKFLARHIIGYLKTIRHGCLSMTLPDGSVESFGGPHTASPCRLTVHDWRFFHRLAFEGEIGFGESYTSGEWDADDLTGLLKCLAANISELNKPVTVLERALRVRERVRFRTRRNTPVGSSRNIAAHYDLSNDFFSLFLDPETMMYSSAVFDSDTQSLGEAQVNKIRKLIELAGIDSRHHVLDLGCGWGGFAIEAARITGCRVTGVTNSPAQSSLATERVIQAGLADRIDIRRCDYRDLTGCFDAIVSIEMLEAVGHDFYPSFFQTCDRLLGSEGRAVFQVITIPDQRYEAYRRKPDWIQKHIFPGGLLPSLTSLTAAMTAGSSLWIDSVRNIGHHYALTLNRWRNNLQKNAGRLHSMGFDPSFLRKWMYYFSYCEAGFSGSYINDLQIVLKRSGS